MAQYKYSDREIKIAEWLGFKWQQSRHYSEDPHWIWPHGGAKRFPRTPGGIPYFDNDDGAAISLFPVLLEKGFVSALFVAHSVPDQWQCDIAKSADYDAVARGIQPTIAQAISAAVLQLIESI